uniref:Uncharacterized protein n=1 Tax=Ananas comosus var. bracteatus TaxID=296719 RepID=A0A6V7QB90_ANACO|nr:unnamed protein product [Ananas comosus var. bracteatus]
MQFDPSWLLLAAWVWLTFFCSQETDATVVQVGSGFCLRSLDRHGGLDWVLLDYLSVLLAFFGLRYPLGGETCLHVLTSPTIFQVSRAMSSGTRREVRGGDSVRVNSGSPVFVADLAYSGDTPIGYLACAVPNGPVVVNIPTLGMSLPHGNPLRRPIPHRRAYIAMAISGVPACMERPS